MVLSLHLVFLCWGSFVNCRSGVQDQGAPWQIFKLLHFSHLGCSGFSHLGCSGALRSGQSLVCSWTISLRPLSGKCNKNFLARGFQSMSPASGSKSPGRRWRGVPPCSLLLCPAFASRDPQQSFQANTGVPSFCSFPPVLWSSQWQTPACRKTDCVKGNYCFVVSKSNFTLQKSSSESFKTRNCGTKIAPVPEWPYAKSGRRFQVLELESPKMSDHIAKNLFCWHSHS